MHSAKVFMLLAYFDYIAVAFTVPEGTPDGVYSVHINDQGDEVHTILANAFDTTYADFEQPQPQPLARSLEERWTRLDKRDSFDVSCGGTIGLHPGNTDAANADLDRQCGGGTPVQPRMNLYSIKGDTVAFFCNFSEAFCRSGCCNVRPCANAGVKFCFSASRRTDSAHITNRCGRYNSGWTTVRKGDAHWSYGYDSKYSTFCGTGP